MKLEDIVSVAPPGAPLTEVKLSDRDDYWGFDRLIFRPVIAVLYGKPRLHFDDDDYTNLQMEYSVTGGAFRRKTYHSNKTNGKCDCGEKFCYDLGIWDGTEDHLWVNDRFLEKVRLRLDYLKTSEMKRTEQRQKATRARNEKKARAASEAI